MTLKRAIRSGRRRFWPILKSMNIGFVDDIEGARFKFVTTERLSELAYCRFHEQHELRIARYFLEEGDTFIDVGANIGLFTCVASRICGEGGLVVAVEPNRDVLPRLIENITFNRAVNVCVFSIATGMEDGLRKLRCPVADLSAFSSMVQVSGSEGWERRIVPVMKIDSLWEKILKKRAITYLKIDVEGFERDVIIGAKEMLSSHTPPIVQFEVNGQAYSDHGVNRTAVVEILKGIGFRIFRLDQKKKSTISKYIGPDEQATSENLFAIPPVCIERFERAVRRASNH